MNDEELKQLVESKIKDYPYLSLKLFKRHDKAGLIVSIQNNRGRGAWNEIIFNYSHNEFCLSACFADGIEPNEMLENLLQMAKEQEQRAIKCQEAQLTFPESLRVHLISAREAGHLSHDEAIHFMEITAPDWRLALK